ncbi:MAG: SiaB family protein kinase, partial [Bacteroidales bacterium]|nr:SiaB family protein kinase [Bacteroidales bacterium]
MSFSINEYYTKLSAGDVLLAFKGSITSDLINEVLDAVEEKLEVANEEGKTRKKLYNVLVESMQNLYHHIEETHEGIDERLEPKFAVLVIAKEGEDYKVTTGNFVQAAKIKKKKKKIDKINS